MKRLHYLILLVFPWAIQSQVNESDTLKLKANLSVSGTYQDGNVETLIFRAKAEFTYKPAEKWVYKTRNSYIYQEFGNEKADEDILSLNFLYLNPEKRLYPQALGFVSTNYRREIDIRYIFGAGATYQILTKKDNWLKTSLTSEYERTDFKKSIFNKDAYNGQSSIETFRATLWLNGRHNIFKEKIIFKHESFFQPSLESSDNFRWQTDLSLEFPIIKYLSFKVNYLYTFESIVVEDQKEEDNFLTFGFSLKNY